MPIWGKALAILTVIAGAVLLMAGPSMTHCAHAAMRGAAAAADAASLLASHPSGPSEQDPCAGGAHVPAAPSEFPPPDHCASGCGATCTVAGLSPTLVPAIHIAPSAIESLDDGDPDVTDREPATPPPRA